MAEQKRTNERVAIAIGPGLDAVLEHRHDHPMRPCVACEIAALREQIERVKAIVHSAVEGHGGVIGKGYVLMREIDVQALMQLDKALLTLPVSVGQKIEQGKTKT
jgi:hypothetical protein